SSSPRVMVVRSGAPIAAALGSPERSSSAIVWWACVVMIFPILFNLIQATGDPPRARRRRAACRNSAGAPRADRRQVERTGTLHPMTGTGALDGLDHHLALAIVPHDIERAVFGSLRHRQRGGAAGLHRAQIAINP